MDQLIRTLNKHFNTAIIGSISEMEKKLGHLWGEGKPYESLTPEEINMLAVKKELRNAILNNGNNQRRAAVAEVNRYFKGR